MKVTIKLKEPIRLSEEKIQQKTKGHTKIYKQAFLAGVRYAEMEHRIEERK